MAAPRVILAATDFSLTSHDAIGAARDLAAALDATLHVVHVIPDPARLPWSVDTGIAYLDLEKAWRAQAEKSLAELRTRSSLPASAVTTVRCGDEANEILAEAHRVSAAFIVLGTHGLGRLARLVMGSVADKVLRHTDRPVLVVPPSEIPAASTEVPA
jgi:nucleotide-binding universal stress UspA family protein